MALEIFVGRELPAWDIFWATTIGSPVNLSTATAITVALRINDTETLITGTVTTYANPVGDGTSADDVPSASFAPALGALDTLTTGHATVILVATFDTLGDREYQGPALIRT